MGTYTAYDIPAVDSAIEAHMQTLQRLCSAYLGGNLDSLILSGSFGRGEGSVLIGSDGSVEPLRDYDVRVIVRSPVVPQLIETIRTEFMRVTGIGSADEQFSGQQGFSLTLEPVTRKQLATTFVRDRDLRVYDHLYASRVICGPDYAPALRFPATEIPKVNGLRFLYQKMVGLVGHFASPAIGADVRRTLLYECDKTFVEICTALVLLAGAYVPSYRARAELFARHWQEWFPDLAQRTPRLDVQINRATHEKLFPGSTAPIPPRESFAQARRALLEVHRFYIRRLYGIDVIPGQTGCAQLRHALKHDYFRTAVIGWLDRRHLNCRPAGWALNRAYQRLLRLKFAHGAGKRGAAAVWEAVRAAEGPPIDIFLASWCTLAACGDTPDATLLRCAEQTLARLPGMTAAQTSTPDEWTHYRAVRAAIIRAYATWEHNR